MKKRIVTVLTVAALAVALACGAVFASGTAEDPLVSLSYLNSVVIPQLTTMIEQKVGEAAGEGQIAVTDEQKLKELVAQEVAKALSEEGSEEGSSDGEGTETGTGTENPGQEGQEGQTPGQETPGQETPGQSAAASQYEAVQLFEGQTIVGTQGGIEVLLRRGSFVCVDPDGQKVTNVTKGGEAGNGNELTLQNLYLIPRSDGRGITCTSSEGWVMVRGAYTVSSAG